MSANKNRYFHLLFVLILLIGTSCLDNKTESQKPNIILVFVDDLGYGDLGCYGQKLIQTPNIDKMAAEGVRFTDFYASSPVCAPSRCSLLTGKHTGNAWVRHNINQLPLGQIPIPDEEITIPEILKEQGYKTGAFGKWSLGSLHNSGDPLKQGFDHFFGYYCQCKAHNYYPEMLWRNKDSVLLNNETVPVNVNFIDYPLSYATKKVDYSAHLVFDEALSFIENNRKSPFFVYYATTLPHSNGEAPIDEKFEVPDWGIYADSAWLPMEKGYASMLTILDNQVGEIIIKLREYGLEENTLVLFTSDNGPTKFAKIFESAGNLKGRKRDLYEGGVRIPFIAWSPGLVSGGKTISQPAVMYDLLPTFASLAGAPIPEKIDGKIIAPLLKKESDKEHDFIYWEFYEGDRAPNQAVRKGNWKAIRFHFDDSQNSEVELYNLANDLAETTNVAASNPEIVHDLLEIMEEQHSTYPNLKYETK